MRTPIPLNAAARGQRLAVLFDAHYDAVMAYARRRTRQLADAEEVASETFIIAWRRLNDLPADYELPWLYAIARRVLSNQRRGGGRRLRMEKRVRGITQNATQDETGVPEVLDALGQLAPTDQEVLRLTAWEGLAPAEIARVLGISPNAAAIRLHRARGRLRHELYGPPNEVKGFSRVRTLLGWKGSISRRSPKEQVR